MVPYSMRLGGDASRNQERALCSWRPSAGPHWGLPGSGGVSVQGLLGRGVAEQRPGIAASTFREREPDYVFFSCKHVLCKKREEMPFFGRSFQGKWLFSVQGQVQPGCGSGESTGKGGFRVCWGQSRNPPWPIEGSGGDVARAELAREELGLHDLRPDESCMCIISEALS